MLWGGYGRIHPLPAGLLGIEEKDRDRDNQAIQTQSIGRQGFSDGREIETHSI